MPLHCSIITPTRTVFDEAVSYVSFPAFDGQHGVMEGQSPLLAALAVGPARLDLPGGASRWFLLEGGFAQVQADRLTLLTSGATPATDLSPDEVEAQLTGAAGRIMSTGETLRQAEHDQQRALAARGLLRRTAGHQS